MYEPIEWFCKLAQSSPLATGVDRRGKAVQSRAFFGSICMRRSSRGMPSALPGGTVADGTCKMNFKFYLILSNFLTVNFG